MKEHNSKLIIFSILFIAVLAVFLSTENLGSQIVFPEQSSSESSSLDDTSILNIFDRKKMINFASEIFEQNGVRSGTIDISKSGFTNKELGIDDNTVNYTEVMLEDGSTISFIEPETEKVDMYNNITVNSLIAVVLTNANGKQKIIKPGHKDFQKYKLLLLREKRVIQNTKLTNLELLLSESSYVGAYEAFLIDEDGEFTIIRTAQLYLNEKKNYMLMLSKNKLGAEYFLVDAGVDLYFDHIYEIGSELLDVKGFVTANNLEHAMYRTFMEMYELGLRKKEVEFQGVRLLIMRK